MVVSSLAVANAFLKIAEEEGKELTNMQLQKLVYIAHGYALALLDRPLYWDTTRAWQWGPVIPNLYDPLRKYGRRIVTEPLETDDKLDDDGEEMNIIKGVWKEYGYLSGGKLSAITHRDNTPWSQTWEKEKFGCIPNDVIGCYYRAL